VTDELKLGEVFRSSLWLLIGTIVSNAAGYVYWIVVSAYVSPSVIGSIAVILALQSVLVMLFSIGIPAGLQRFIGMIYAKGDEESISTYFGTGLVYLVVIHILVSITILVGSLTSTGFLGLSAIELILIALILILTSWSPLFHSLFIATMRTEVIAKSLIASSTLKIVIGLMLLNLGLGFWGAISGFIMGFITVDAVFLFYSTRVFSSKAMFKPTLDSLKNLVLTGYAAWIPRLLATLGNSVGVLIVFSIIGSGETGLYYLAFAVGQIVYVLPTRGLALMFPLLSGMQHGRKQAISQAIRLSLVATAPLACTLAVYSYLPFLLLGPDYLPASLMLQILVLGALLTPIVVGYNSYVYATGKYQHVTGIGVSLNLGRIILYFPLVVAISGLGASISYSLGPAIAILAVVVSSRRTGYRLDWGMYVKTILVPGSIAMILVMFNIHWLVGVPVLLLATVGGYGRLGIITRNDIDEIARSILSEETVGRFYAYASPALNLMFGD